MTDTTSEIRFDAAGDIRHDDLAAVMELLGVIRRIARNRPIPDASYKNGVVGILMVATDRAGMAWDQFGDWTDEVLYDALVRYEAAINEDPDNA